VISRASTGDISRRIKAATLPLIEVPPTPLPPMSIIPHQRGKKQVVPHWQRP
jgi:hypothetical protein